MGPRQYLLGVVVLVSAIQLTLFVLPTTRIEQQSIAQLKVFVNNLPPSHVGAPNTRHREAALRRLANHQEVSIFALLAANALQNSTHVVTGAPRKHSSPLWGQNEAWEKRIDNGYPSVVYQQGSGSLTYQMWYTAFLDCDDADSDCASGNRSSGLLYATSQDGLQWSKPRLGIHTAAPYIVNLVNNTDISKLDLGSNIVLLGKDLGVFYDQHADLYRAFGVFCSRKNSHCRGGVSQSVDGLKWDPMSEVTWPVPHKYDCFNNMFYDNDAQEYVVTSRMYTAEHGRIISMSAIPLREVSSNSKWSPMKAVLLGNASHQMYSQTAFPWLGVYLAFTMVYTTESDKVRCHMSWSQDRQTWHLLGEAIPLGDSGSFDSHICFAARPVFPEADEAWVYYMGGNGPHSGPRASSLGLAVFQASHLLGAVGNGTLATVPLTCVSPRLRVVCNGTVAVYAGTSQLKSKLQSETRNLSVDFDTSRFVGQKVRLLFQLSTESSLYTVHFME